jgi:hypothetical protein
LTLKEFSLPLFWFPLVKKIRENLFSIAIEQKLRTLSLFRIGSYNRDRCLNLCFDCYISSELVLILDRTQWQNTNILMISLGGKKRSIPLYWKILTHKGASNLTKQKAVIRSVIRLLKGQKIII